jgi:putative salt-induced outer membrane protein YdiY
MCRIRKKLLLVLIAVFLLPVELFAQEKTEPDRWDSSIGISYVAASGNSAAQTLSITGEANRKGDKNELGLKAGTVYGKSEGETTSEYWYANARYNHDISRKAYLFGLLGLEGNELADYHLRVSAHPGIGYRFLENKHELRGEIGPGYIFEDRIGDDNLSFISGRAYASYKFQLTKKAAFSQDAEYLHDFDDADDFRFNANTSLVVKISEWISLKTGVSVQYVNEPPEDAEDTDVFTSTSLIFTF